MPVDHTHLFLLSRRLDYLARESNAAEGEPSHSLCPKSKHWCLSLLTPSTFLRVHAGRLLLPRRVCVCVSVCVSVCEEGAGYEGDGRSV